MFQIGKINSIVGNYEKGLSVLYRALRIQETADTININATLNTIGTILKSIKRFPEAIKTYQLVLDNDSLNADAVMNMGTVYFEMDKSEQAKLYYHKALKIDKSNNNDWAVAYDYENIGSLFYKMALYDSALVYQMNALKLRKALPNKVEEGQSLSQVGITHIYDKLAVLKAEQKDFSKAYDYLRLYTMLGDSLLNETSTKQISEYKVNYETEKKDQQIIFLAQQKELQEKEIQRQATIKKAVTSGLLLIALLAGLLWYTLRQRLKNQKQLASKNVEIKEVNFKRQLTELEMKALQAQINPHFIFNCINSINQMILDGENPCASKYLTKFSKLIRLILENAENAEVSLKDELALLESYIQLEALRFKGKIKHLIKINDAIDVENTYIPSMVLQPFVENAIWHGLMHKTKKGQGCITISVEKDQDQRLICLIEDNGVGREKAMELQQKSIWKSKSLGIKITEERLKLVSKELQKQLIHITDLKDALG
ncbi:MAG TPA: histidine kinase [Gillisia sp.]|nr:histidine kinase [Gillisia sp.]